MTTESSADVTRQRLIDAALTLFGDVGYTRATTRAIAEKAGVNEVTLFRHFGSKKNLLFDCIRAGNQTGFAETFRAHLTGDYEADIRIMAGLQMTDTLRKFDVLRLLLCDARAVAELQEALVQGAASNGALLADYFRQQIVDGVVRADLDPLTLAHSFDSLFSSYILLESLMGATPLPSVPSDNVVNSLAGLFYRGTRAATGD